MAANSKTAALRCRVALPLLVGVLLLALAGPLGAAPVEPTLARAAECVGDECEPAPPPPEDQTPGTAVVEGPPNPPIHFPAPHHKKPHRGKHHRHHRRAVSQ